MNYNRKQNVWIAVLMILMLCVPSAAFAVVDPPADIYVGDYAGVLSEETEQYIIEQNQVLAQATGAQIVIVTVDFLDGMDIEDYAYTIFNDWGIGDKEKNNGLLLLLAIGEENYWAMQGKGLEGVLSSGMLGDYLYEYLEPDFAAGDYDAGVYKVFNAFLGWFQDYYDSSSSSVNGITASGTSSARTENERYAEDDDDGISLLLIILVVIVIIVLISMNNRRKDQKRKNDRNNRSGGSGGRYDDRKYDEKYGRNQKESYKESYGRDAWDGGDDYERKRSSRDVIFIPGLFGGGHNHSDSHNDGGMDEIGDVLDDIFGGGTSRGGGAGRSSGGFGGFGSSGGFGGFGGGFGGGGSRGGGAGRG